MTYAERATDYARRVVDGEAPACKYVELACERHLDDLERVPDADWPYRFDDDLANRVCEFVELMPHVKGKWMGSTIELEDWQCFILGCVFGWVKKSNGKRRFRKVYEEVPRKNAKSTKAAAVGNYLFAADGEPGPEVYSGAGSEDQAWEVFGPARQMVKRSPDLQDALGVEVHAKALSIPSNNGKFRPVIGKPGDGASPHGTITDEYHEHSTSDQLDTFITGMGSREQPLAWVVTTAGDDTSGPCYDLRSDAINVLEGTVADETFFCIIYTIDEDDDWTSEEALEKANPNLGVSVFREYLLAQQRDAVNNPRKQSVFKTKHLNVWVTAASPYFNLEHWNRLADPTLDPAQFAGEACWIGLDLASKIDLTAKVKVFRREESDGLHYYAFGDFYLPEDRAQDPAKRHYDGWVRSGDLHVAGEARTDYDAIEADVQADAELHRVVQLGFDPYQASQLIQHLMNHGIECVEVPQTVVHMSEPMKEVQALIQDGRLHHDGNPVFAWGISNVTARIDQKDNVFPRKEKPENKIDPAVALIIAVGRAMAGEQEVAEPSIMVVGSG